MDGARLSITSGWPYSQKRLAAVWTAICITVIGIQVPTLTRDPLLYQDEVQILDYGRVALNPETSWGIVWDVDEQAPILIPAYAGAVLQELGYRLTEPSNLGSRLVSLGAGVLAATCLLGWLIVRRIPPIASLALALAFLVDPVFSGIYRGGRVDAWAFATCLGACWLLRYACLRRGENERALRPVFAAGFLAGISPFFWPNAPILWPLVLLELFNLLKSPLGAGESNAGPNRGRLICSFGLGGLCAVGLAVVPALFHWELWWQSLKAVMAVQAFAAVVKVSIVDLLAIHDPSVAICLLISLFFCRDWGLIVALGLALLIVYQTMVYLPRVTYVLPYFFAIIAVAVSRVQHQQYSGRTGKFVMNRVLAVLLIWNIADTLILQPYLTAVRGPATDPSQVRNELKRVIGAGAYRVLTDEWSAYTAGRDLGWQQYRSGTGYQDSKYLELLKSMDYLVLKEPPLWQNTLDLVDDAGFEVQETIHFKESEPIKWSVGSLEFRFPPVAYPSIRVYRKSVSEE